MSMNKNTLLARPDTSLITGSVGAIEDNVGRGEEGASPPRNLEGDTLRIDPIETESDVWLREQVMHLQSQNALLKAALEGNTETSRGRGSSNPSRQNRSAVPQPGTTDRECLPYEIDVAHPGYALQEGAWYQEEEEEEPRSNDKSFACPPSPSAALNPFCTTGFVRSPSMTPHR